MQSTETKSIEIRPLNTIGRAMSRWARRGAIQTTVEFHGRLRTAIDQAGIALSWMSRGYQYDTRNLRQRMVAGNYYWSRAFRALVRGL